VNRYAAVSGTGLLGGMLARETFALRSFAASIRGLRTANSGIENPWAVRHTGSAVLTVACVAPSRVRRLPS
jgi:hypothetical protein